LTRSSQKRLVVAGAIAAVVALVIWSVVLLRDDDSVLSILIRREHIGWAPDSTSGDVLRRMSKYQKRGRYDDAIRAGVMWTEKSPDDGSNVWLYMDVSALYLLKAAKDGEHAEEDVKQALLYRDKVLPFASDGLYSLEQLAAISESAGDISAAQRCVQYRNAIKITDRMAVLLSEEKDRVARQFKPRLDDVERIKCDSDRAGAMVNRLRGKLQDSACR
jgi:tetratricopeptide (TPR) repeat protein